MSNITYLVIGIVAGYIVGRMHTKAAIWARQGKNSSLVSEQGEEKKKNLEKIVGYFDDKAQVSNNDIERFLGVSDATAERYLNELEHSGQIRQVGRTGKQVTYEKV